MTNVEINIAIAQLCGWKRVPLLMNPHFWIHYPSEKQCRHDEALPDYCKDLNAMHEAENKLSNQQHRKFRKHLNYILFERGMTISCATRKLVSATARQRAEAFLLTFNKWKQ